MKKKNKWIIIFLLPTLLLCILIYGAPTFIMFGSSFFDWRLLSGIEFSGLKNYMSLFQDKTFHKALFNTILWAGLQGSLNIGLGVVVALILARKEFYWKFVRTIYVIPNIISNAALGVMFVTMFSPRIGIINSLIRAIGFHDFNVNWFSNYDTAFWAITATWLPYAGICTILVLAEITAIDDAILEAAKMDGASRFKTDIYIVLPAVRNIIATCVVLGATSALKNFDMIFITTSGGPGKATINLPLYIYKTAMLELNFGYANTISVIVVLLGIFMVIGIRNIFKLGDDHI